jgi:hypothetical protein
MTALAFTAKELVTLFLPVFNGFSQLDSPFHCRCGLERATLLPVIFNSPNFENTVGYLMVFNPIVTKSK